MKRKKITLDSNELNEISPENLEEVSGGFHWGGGFPVGIPWPPGGGFPGLPPGGFPGLPPGFPVGIPGF